MRSRAPRDHHRGGLRGPAGLREPGRQSVDGQRGVRDVTSSGTVSAPQLFSNTLTVTNTSDFLDDLFLTKNWAGWSKLQVSNNSAVPDSGPELRLLGNQSARVFLERDGTHQCELMINDEALVQTKSLSTQLSLTTNQRNPGCLVIADNTGNVVCNTSFTDLSDSRVKTEIAEADVAELLQLFDSVETKQYKRPDMNGDLRLGFASDDFAGTKWKDLARLPRGQVLLQRLATTAMALRSSGRFVRCTASAGNSRSSVANLLPRSVVTTKFPSSPVSSRAARLVARPTVSAFLFCRPSTQSSRSSPPCSFPAAAELLTRRPGRLHDLGARSRK